LQIIFRIGIDCEQISSWKAFIEPMFLLATATAARFVTGFKTLKYNPSQNPKDVLSKCVSK
jgi:hypothetical protein